MCFFRRTMIRDANAQPPAECPPPWSLKGRGYLVCMRFPCEVLRGEGTFLPASLRGGVRSRFAWVMFVDYEQADCGPYRELLFIPGRADFRSGRFLTISKIYVSSMSSVENGRRNWGIPKELAEFDVRYDRKGRDEVRVTRDGRAVAEFVFRPRGPRLPMLVHWLPKRLLTLGQQLGGREFIYTPEARGKTRWAKMERATSDAALFPDLAAGKVLACFAVPEFRMVFPESRIRAL